MLSLVTSSARLSVAFLDKIKLNIEKLPTLIELLTLPILLL